MSNVILRGRISYAHIFEPHAMNPSSDPKYSLSLLIPKADAEMVEKAKRAINEAISDGMDKKWGGKRPGNLRTPLRDGDEDRPDDPVYGGCYFINCNANEKYPPKVVLRYRDPVTKEIVYGDEESVYSGCICNVSVSFYPYDVNGNRGVAAGLGNVQKWEDGERLGGGARSVESDFGFEDAEDVDLDDLL